MMSKTSLAFFNEPVLRGWCGFWIAPQPHRLGGPQARITRVVSTGDFSWPHAGTFTWPRTSRGAGTGSEHEPGRRGGAQLRPDDEEVRQGADNPGEQGDQDPHELVLPDRLV